MSENENTSNSADQPNAQTRPIAGSDVSRADATDRDPGPPANSKDPVEEEMEIARKHADPSRGDKVVDGGDRVSTDKGGNPQE